MRRTVLFVLTLLVSINTFAASLNIGSAIENSLKKQNSYSQHQSSMIYGGKDISRPVIATANETMWTGAPILDG